MLHCRRVASVRGPVLVVDGDVDLSSVPQLADSLGRFVLDHAGARSWLDLDGVLVLDDAGLGVVLGSVGRARLHKGDLVVVCSQPRMIERFTLTGFDRAVRVVAGIA